MMIVHELGHMLHAWTSGGRVTQVVLHPLAISRTDVVPNPHPLFVVWGGPVWGCLLPLLVWFVGSRLRWSRIYVVRFFAGFCLIANGAYIGSGIAYPVGDAEQMRQLGTPAWVMGCFGVVTVAAGLLLWHRQGRNFGISKNAEPADPTTAVILTVIVLLIAAVETMFSN